MAKRAVVCLEGFLPDVSNPSMVHFYGSVPIPEKGSCLPGVPKGSQSTLVKSRDSTEIPDFTLCPTQLLTGGL